MLGRQAYFINTATVTEGYDRNLYEELTAKKAYSPFVRPAQNHDSAILLFMNLSLIQILEVDEKRQLITTNALVNLDWKDHNFVWNLEEHGNITSLLLPSENIWTPDLVLYNNAGGDWDLVSSSSTKVFVNHDGTVIWRPPIIFKSQCEINVEYFPFDMQNCSMKIGVWTYHGFLIDLRHTSQRAKSQPSFDNCRSRIDHAIDLSMFTVDVQWDLIGVSASRNIEFYPCCPEPYLDITFHIILRRKPLFFGVNVICPCISISILTVLVFYLPADSREKICLSISTLIALTVFFLLVFEISPPTSLNCRKLIRPLLSNSTIELYDNITKAKANIPEELSVEQLETSLDKVRKMIIYFRRQKEWNKVTRSEWKYVAFVIDRLLLWIFIGTTAIDWGFYITTITKQLMEKHGSITMVIPSFRLAMTVSIRGTICARHVLISFYESAPTLGVKERALTSSSNPPFDAINVTRLSCETKLV
ncbi:hypothetical protein ACTXT7_000671 [Hymenolepis weldensis]